MWRQPSRCEDKSREGQVFPAYDADGYTHNEADGFSLFLQERCQRIFFIRHAEGFHNVAERESRTNPQNLVLLRENSGFVYWDPKLTPRGESQCQKLKAAIRGDSVWGFAKPLNLDLVVVSPTTRTLQTAQLSLGSPETPGAPPFLAHEGCRERISESMCDGRRSVQELQREFPGVDFSLIESDSDYMFLNEKETDEACKKRAVEFLKWLCGRPEQRIGVVTHSLFLKNLMEQFASNVADEDRFAIHKLTANAEMRSVMLCAHRKFPSTARLPDEEHEWIKCRKERAQWSPDAV